MGMARGCQSIPPACHTGLLQPSPCRVRSSGAQPELFCSLGTAALQRHAIAAALVNAVGHVPHALESLTLRQDYSGEVANKVFTLLNSIQQSCETGRALASC